MTRPAGRRRAMVVLFSWLLSCSHGGTADRDAAAPSDAGTNGGPDGTSGDPCAICSSSQVCTGGVCLSLPAQCPCPKGAYCDLSTNSCKAGCIGDGDCNPGTFCDVVARQCRPGLAWSIEQVGTAKLRGIWGSSATDVYVAGYDGIIRHSSGDGLWSPQPTPSNLTLTALWGSGPHDLYAVGFGGAILHSTGNGTWTAQTSPETENLYALWGSGPSDVYAAGYSYVLHSTGDGMWKVSWQRLGATFGGLWGSSASNVYAAVTAGLIMQSPGNDMWATQTSQNPDVQMTSVWGASASNLYVASTPVNGSTVPGAIQRSTGSGTWTIDTVPSNNGLIALWGSGPSDVYAVGLGGVILHSDGSTWETRKSPTTNDLLGIWGPSASEAYILGDEGTILHGR
jgi:hypothetical protein